MSDGTKGRKRLWWILGLLIVAAVVLITVFVLPPGKGSWDRGRDGLGRTNAPASRSNDNADDAEAGAAGDASGDSVISEDIGLLEDLRDDVHEGTYEALMARGFPPIRGPRKTVVQHTAKQSLEEVVADMGNIVSLGLCKTAIGEFPKLRNQVGHWRAMTYHVKTLRVIEEGRSDPQRVAPLLEQELVKTMQSYKTSFGAGGTQTSVGIDDEYFNKHGRYEHRGFENLRRHNMLYASFYALACMEQLRSPEHLRKWCELQRWCETEQLPMVVCKDMSIWLIDKYFRQSGADQTPEGRRFFELTENAGVAPRTVKRSRWNAPWDADDSLLTMAGAKVKDLPAIDVLEVPSSVQLDEATKDAAIDLFLRHAGSNSEQLGTTPDAI